MHATRPASPLEKDTRNPLVQACNGSVYLHARVNRDGLKDGDRETRDPFKDRRESPKRYFPVGTRRLSSSNQFWTRVISVTGAGFLPSYFTIRKPGVPTKYSVLAQIVALAVLC